MRFLFIIEAEGLTLADANHLSGLEWHALTEEEREDYNKQAREQPSNSSFNLKKELKRALSRLSDLVSYILIILVIFSVWMYLHNNYNALYLGVTLLIYVYTYI